MTSADSPLWVRIEPGGRSAVDLQIMLLSVVAVALGFSFILILERELAWFAGVFAGAATLCMLLIFFLVRRLTEIDFEARDRLAEAHEMWARDSMREDGSIHDVIFTIATDGYRRVPAYNERGFDYSIWRKLYESAGLTPPRSLVMALNFDSLLPLMKQVGPSVEFVEPERLRMGRRVSINWMTFITGFNILIWMRIAFFSTFTVSLTLIMLFHGFVVLFLIAKLLIDCGIGWAGLLVAPGRIAQSGLLDQSERTCEESVIVMDSSHLKPKCGVYTHDGKWLSLSPRSIRDKQLARLWTLWHYDGPPAPPIFESASRPTEGNGESSFGV